MSLLLNSRKQSFCVPQKLFMPPPLPSHATLAPGLSGKTLSICYDLQATECGNLKFIQNTKILYIKATTYEQINFGICGQVITISQVENRKKVINIETLYFGSKPTEIYKKKVCRLANQIEHIVLLVLLFNFYS